MSELVLAERYAQAFVNITPDLKALKENLDYLRKWERFLQEHSKISELAKHPIIPFVKKRKVLEQLDNFVSYPGMVRKYILYLVQKERINYLPLIIDQIEMNIDKKEGILRGTLRVGRELSDSCQEELLKSLGDKLGKKLEVEVEYDPNILGGLILQTENKIFDASIKNFFKRFLQNIQKGV